ncbi:MAG: bifunctional DNA-formamidopyrimidine glycosylase/DNA-(apurinic or apyrimidinic site) lyase [Chloroflexota bacterium]
MPELPEVETYISAVKPHLIGRRIEQIEVFWGRTLSDPNSLVGDLPGRTINSITRRGKYMRFDLGNSFELAVHLGMSGRVDYVDNIEVHKHERARVQLIDGGVFRFIDPRKFGRLHLIKQPEAFFSRLGPEPLDGELTAEWLSRCFHKRKRAIKPLLMDQALVAGIGNIYADEALHRAAILPTRPGGTLTMSELERLVDAIRHVLLKAIEYGGSSIDSAYLGGQMQDEFVVYQRTNEPCHGCGTPIERIVLNQRSAHYCPSCQR